MNLCIQTVFLTFRGHLKPHPDWYPLGVWESSRSRNLVTNNCRHLEGYSRKLALRAPTKSCLLDPVPTNILKDCLDELLPILSTTINLSLESGFFPDIWKESIVTPLLKKQGLDLVFKNFRPISNLSFVSKLAERVAADQIQSYLNEHDLFPSLQSAYRRHHSTETYVGTIDMILTELSYRGLDLRFALSRLTHLGSVIHRSTFTVV